MCFLFDCGKTSAVEVPATFKIPELGTQPVRGYVSLMELLKTKVAQQRKYLVVTFGYK